MRTNVGGCAQGLCAPRVKSTVRVERHNPFGLCAGVVRPLCALRVKNIVRFERHNPFGLFRIAFSAWHNPFDLCAKFISLIFVLLNTILFSVGRFVKPVSCVFSLYVREQPSLKSSLERSKHPSTSSPKQKPPKHVPTTSQNLSQIYPQGLPKTSSNDEVSKFLF